MAFGIPTTPEIAALIKDAIAEAQAGGVALEDHLAPLIQAAITNAVAGLQAGLNTDLAEVNDIVDHGLARVDALVARLEALAERGIVVSLGPAKS
jgi:hypothetical protein